MEHTALSQLDAVSMLPGVIRAVGLPDLHAGKTPVGIAVESQGRIYPYLVGNDIGCGMGFFETHVSLRKYKQDKFVSRLNHIRALEDIPAENPYPEESPIFDLGTLGGGNHFAEFQAVDTVYDEERFKALGIDKDMLLLLIHSGSRGYGQRILNAFSDNCGYDVCSEQGGAYLKEHGDAVLWARRNRFVTATKLIDWLGYTAELKPIIDCCHNFVEERGDIIIHRKGAVSAFDGMVIIPGSRGSLTYIVKPADDTELSAFSLSHGAGRKWARSLCKSRISGKYDCDTLRQNKFGGRVVCHDTELLFQEAPEAYKNIDHVISSLLEHRLCSVVATLRPLITYKG
jgi:release factor H-coupled RctB family protein